MTLIPPSWRPPRSEYIFKQSGKYGGSAHIVVNVDDVLSYLRREIDTLRITTMCDKSLKYNDEYSTLKQTDGLIRNVCRECVINYDSYEKGEAVQKRKEEYKERNKDLPF